MSFTETRLNLGVPPSTGGPGFRTKSIKAGSGFERRNPQRSEPLFQGDIGKLLLGEGQIAYIIAFFNARKGRAIGFRYKYWGDYTCTRNAEAVDAFTSTQGVVGRIMGDESAPYQLQKKYTNFGVDSYKTIYKPVPGTVSLYVDGEQVGVEIDHNSGRVTFDDPPGDAVITWDGEFDLPVRFDSDKLPGLMEFLDPETQRIYYRFDSLPVVELVQAAPVIYDFVERVACSTPLGSTLSGLRWELPCLEHTSETNCSCPSYVFNSATFDGDPEVLYGVGLRFRGVVELKPYSGGLNDGAYFQIGGTPSTEDNNNIYRLEISDPPQTYYLNRGGYQLYCAQIDYIKEIQMSGAATVTLIADAVGEGQLKNIDANGHPIVVPDIPPDPEAYDGEFIQIDVVSVEPLD